MIDHLYQNTILKNPKSVLIVLFIALISFGYYSKDFRLDASSETLLIDGDPDLKYLQEISNQVESGEAIFLFNDVGDPALMKDNNDDTAVYVVMPMRV